MSRAHITLLSSLLVAILALPAEAQTALPAEAQTPTDSAAADTVAPKKKSRFGGIMNKAKQVAGNKAIQNAAKGAATGVACTVVPGAAVVSAATGKGPCANSGLVGMVTGEGGIKGAATAMASGMAGGAAAKAAAKVTGSGGAKGAAAAGALQAVTGQGGLTQGAAMAAAQAAAGRMATGAAATALKKGASTKTAMPNGAGADMAGAMAAMGAAGAAMGNMTAGMAKVATVDFRELKALLPESIRGMKRTDATGQTQGAMGIQISSAEGSYSSDDGKSVDISIADIGNVAGFAGAAAYAWTSTEVDRETDGGYEKTTTFKGFKALEKYDRQSKSGGLSVLVGDRFVVGVEGNNVDMDALKAALGSVDLRKLAGMKGKGAK